VDVGADVGDTAILFSLRGARRVIVLEPYPRLYGEALLNIKANGLANRVVMFTQASALQTERSAPTSAMWRNILSLGRAAIATSR
jgi:FkbM family methyltransferase